MRGRRRSPGGAAQRAVIGRLVSAPAWHRMWQYGAAPQGRRHQLIVDLVAIALTVKVIVGAAKRGMSGSQ